jgi:4-hydroxythreonine-4-phosphate dehydrogenase
MERRNSVIGLLLGDSTGIGPEIIVKALQKEEICRAATWVLIGDERVLRKAEEVAGMKVPYKKISSLTELKQDEDYLAFVDLRNLDPKEVTPGCISELSGKVTGDTLKYALNLAQEGNLDGIVYGPLNKGALHKGGYHFEDEIHFFASILNYDGIFSEINVMDNLWVTRVTSHVPLKEVASLVTRERVESIIEFAHENLTRVGMENPRIVVCALNPHAGDGGLIGKEEIEVISPAIQSSKRKGWNVEGPFPADTVFLRYHKEPFDCLVGMYHDQAQTGMKLMGFHKGVTMSGGLPVVLTTPAHGTAFDIAGKGMANSGAMESAMLLAAKMSEFKNIQKERNT